RQLVTRLRIGGIVAFHENDFSYPPTVFPPTGLWRKLQGWMIPPPDTPGPNMRMGTNLFRTYVDAGLPAPLLQAEAPAGGGREWPGYEYVVETFRSLMPSIQARTGFDPKDVDIDTLADRLREDVVRHDGVQMLPIMYGAWSHRRG